MQALPSMIVEAVAEPDAGLRALLAGDVAAAGNTSDAGAPRPRTGPTVDVTADSAAAPGAPDVVVVAVHPPTDDEADPRADEGVPALVEQWGVDAARRLRRGKAVGAAGEITWIDLERERPDVVVALGLGAATAADARRAAAALVRRLRGIDEVLVPATRGMVAPVLEAFTEGLLLGLPAPTWATTSSAAGPGRVRLVVGDAVGDLAQGQRAIDAGRVRAGATLAARVLVHTPSNVKDPAWLAERAVVIGEAAGLRVRVLDEHDLAEQGFGGILAVGAGSLRAPRLVRMTWEPPGAGALRHVVLVGKGITFDSGGLSLKPAKMQIPMKTDMSGAAAVCAALGALDRVRPAGVRVTGLLCLAENLPGASAMRPGDVVTHHGGLTSEVLNTDAEGRLVLGDGLDHAVTDLRADVVVDIATLTGAATLGLGRSHAALFSNSDRLASALLEAGELAGERMWRLPLFADYADLITSELADQANVHTTPGAGPGAITAALFLQRFVGSTPWAHLDIAGVGRSDADRGELPKGGTGFGARALLRWLAAGAPA